MCRMMLMTVLLWSPVVVTIEIGVAIALGVASVVLRLVSDTLARGAVADVLALAAVLAGLWCLLSAVLLTFICPLLWAGALLALVFSVAGWRFPLRVWSKAWQGRKSRRGKRVKYYLIASLLHAPWVLAVVLGSVRIVVLFCLTEPMKRAQMHTLLQAAEWGVVFLIFFCLLRMYQKHQFAALRRSLILSIPLCVLFLQLW